MSGKKLRKQIPRRMKGYTGPYPYHMLNDARFTLMRSIEMKDSVVWYQIRKKTGIFDNGERAADWPGWGDHSTYYSHADLFEENSIEGEFLQRRQPALAVTSTPSATITTADQNEDSQELDSSVEVIVHDNDNSVVEILNDTGNTSPSKPSPNEEKALTEIPLTKRDNLISDSVKDTTSFASTTKEQDTNNIFIEIDEWDKNSSSDTNNSSKSFRKVTKRMTVSSSSARSGNCSPEEGEIIDSDEESGIVVEIFDESDSSDVQIMGEESGINDSVIVIEDDKKYKGKGNPSPQKLTAWTPLRHPVSSESNEDSDCVILNKSDMNIYKVDSKEGKNKVPISEKKQDDANKCVDQKLDTSEKTNINKALDFLPDDKSISKDKGLGQNDDIVEAYKCDFCDEIFLVPKTVLDHFDHSIHFSASKVYYDRKRESYQLTEKLVFMQKDNLFKKTVAVCPKYTCNKVFNTVYDCSLHHRLKHDNVGDLITGLADVLKTEKFINPCFTRACPICNARNPAVNKTNEINEILDKKLFKKNITLFSDWLAGHFARNHAPFDYNQGDCHFICPECHDVFEDLSRALIHQVLNHQMKPLTHDMELIVIQTGKVKTRPVPELVKTNENDLKFSKTNDGCSSNSSAASTSNAENGEFFVIDRKPMPPGKQTYGNIEYGHVSSLQNSTNAQDQPVGTSNNLELEEISSEIHCHPSHMFLCDYCDYKTKDRQAIYKHLCDEVHKSASIVQVDSNLKPVTMFKQMAVESYMSSFKKFVAACPVGGCTRLFPDIFQCSVHVSLFHKITQNICGVAEIIQSVDIFLPAKPVCQVCNITFADRETFKKHIKDLDHYPPDCRIKSLPYHVKFVCSYCELILEAYLPALSHVHMKHPFKVIQDSFQVRLVHTSKSVQRKPMLPYSPNSVGEVRNIQMNLNAMAGLKRTLGKTGNKQLCKKRRKLKALKKKVKDAIKPDPI